MAMRAIIAQTSSALAAASSAECITTSTSNRTMRRTTISQRPRRLRVRSRSERNAINDKMVVPIASSARERCSLLAGSHRFSGGAAIAAAPALEAASRFVPRIRALPFLDRRPERQRKSRDPTVRSIGQLQATVMDIFWKRDSATVREVVEALARRRRPLAHTTVLTLVTRLWSRGLLTRVPEGRGFRYRAARTREQLLADLSDELIDRLFKEFGDIGLARLNEKLGELDTSSLRKLRKDAK